MGLFILIYNKLMALFIEIAFNSLPFIRMHILFAGLSQQAPSGSSPRGLLKSGNYSSPCLPCQKGIVQYGGSSGVSMINRGLNNSIFIERSPENHMGNSMQLFIPMRASQH